MKSIFPAVFLAVPCVLAISSCSQTRKGDVTFAKATFESLARGDSAVADKIDWPVFTALGTNIGADYIKLPTEVEKNTFRTGFITQFATSFRETGASVDQFSNWRVTFHDGQRTEVAADSTNGTLTLTVGSRDGLDRLSSLNVVK